jgi:hypothetical protein
VLKTPFGQYAVVRQAAAVGMCKLAEVRREKPQAIRRVEEAVKVAARTPGLEKRLYRGGKTQEDLKIPPKPHETPCRSPVKTIQIQRQPASDENTYIVWWGHYAI